MTRTDFHQRVEALWADVFQHAPALLRQGGTRIEAYEALEDSKAVQLFRLGAFSQLRCDPALVPLLTQAHNPSQAMSGRALAQRLPDHTLDYDHIETVFYLYPPDYEPFVLSDVDLRVVSAADAAALETLKAACTEHEIDDSWVGVDDELAVATFDGDQMTACASMYTMWRHFADPGVLVHPEYRRQGLGLAVVSAICRQVLEEERVMNYRCDQKNIASAGLAKRLGFEATYEIEVFDVVAR